MFRLFPVIVGATLLAAASLANASPPAHANGHAWAKGHSKAGAVPEPETMLLTLVGLAAVGLIRRRKR